MNLNWREAYDKATHYRLILYLLIVEGLNVLISTAVEGGLFEAIEVGNDKVRISHLQYADDTILLGTGHPNNAWAKRYILSSFLA